VLVSGVCLIRSGAAVFPKETTFAQKKKLWPKKVAFITKQLTARRTPSMNPHRVRFMFPLFDLELVSESTSLHGSSFLPSRASRSPSTASATSGESSGGAPQIEQMYSNSVRPLTPPVFKKSGSTQSVHDLASLTKILGAGPCHCRVRRRLSVQPRRYLVARDSLGLFVRSRRRAQPSCQLPSASASPSLRCTWRG